MRLKTRIKSLLKKMDSRRKMEYILALCKRIDNFRHDLKVKVVDTFIDYPFYITVEIHDKIDMWYDRYINDRVTYIVHWNIKGLKSFYKQKVEELNELHNYVNGINYELKQVMPDKRKKIGVIDYTHIKYVFATNVFGKVYSGMIYDNHPQVGLVLGRFFDNNGELYKFQNEIDNSYLIQPMDEENDFKRYFNNCSKLFINGNNTSTEMINEYNQLNDYWAVQQTFLKLKNEKK